MFFTDISSGSRQLEPLDTDSPFFVDVVSFVLLFLCPLYFLDFSATVFVASTRQSVSSVRISFRELVHVTRSVLSNKDPVLYDALLLYPLRRTRPTRVCAPFVRGGFASA